VASLRVAPDIFRSEKVRSWLSRLEVSMLSGSIKRALFALSPFLVRIEMFARCLCNFIFDSHCTQLHRTTATNWLTSGCGCQIALASVTSVFGRIVPNWLTRLRALGRSRDVEKREVQLAELGAYQCLGSRARASFSRLRACFCMSANQRISLAMSSRLTRAVAQD
jgi:hypothetical protein